MRQRVSSAVNTLQIIYIFEGEAEVAVMLRAPPGVNWYPHGLTDKKNILCSCSLIGRAHKLSWLSFP